MVISRTFFVTSILLISPLFAFAQTSPAQRGTDVYIVSFFKATPGQTPALASLLRQQDPNNPMAGHTLLLAHSQGSNWDYCLIQHMGKTATVTIAPAPAANPNATPARGPHSDTFVSGPSWEEFSKLMVAPASGVYVVSTHSQVPGHRGDLLMALAKTTTKVPVDRVLFEHIDGQAWAFLTLERYNSWSDFGTEMAANPPGSQGWNDIRRHSESHEDTLAERVR